MFMGLTKLIFENSGPRILSLTEDTFIFGSGCPYLLTDKSYLGKIYYTTPILSNFILATFGLFTAIL